LSLILAPAPKRERGRRIFLGYLNEYEPAIPVKQLFQRELCRMQAQQPANVLDVRIKSAQKCAQAALEEAGL
jgi:hypothetical protein